MEVLVVLITLAVITVVGILIFLGGRAIFEFIVEHNCLKYIVIGLFALALANMFGPIVLVVGGILLFKCAINIIGYILGKYGPSPPTHIPGINEKTSVNYEEDDFDTYKSSWGEKYRYDRLNGELIDKNHQRIKVSQVYYGSDFQLKDSHGNIYD